MKISRIFHKWKNTQINFYRQNSSVCRMYFSKFYEKVGAIYWLLFHLIWIFFVLNWDFYSKSWIVDFFTRFTHEKTPRNNFSCQNFSIETNYLYTDAENPNKLVCIFFTSCRSALKLFYLIYLKSLMNKDPVQRGGKTLVTTG